jgi:hypothetical protein
MIFSILVIVAMLAVFFSMQAMAAVDNIGSKWDGGNLIFYSKTTGNNIAKFDATNDRFDLLDALAFNGTELTATVAELNELDLSAVGAVSKIKKINMTAADFSDTSEVDTGWDLPATAIVKNVFINVNTKEETATTKTIDVGTNGSGSDDPNGFLAGVSVATAGLVKGTLASGGQTLGALLYADEDGSGALVPEPDITSGGESVTVTAGEAFTEADFDILIEYIEIS